MRKNYCKWQKKIKKFEKLSILGSFFILNKVINGCQGGKIIDVAISIAEKEARRVKRFEIRNR